MDLEPRAEDRGHWITHPRLAYSVAATQLGLVSFARSAVLGPTQGLLCPIATVRAAGPWTGAPNHKAPRLGPRAFSISLENSFGGNFVWLYISIHASISS